MGFGDESSNKKGLVAITGLVAVVIALGMVYHTTLTSEDEESLGRVLNKRT
jgi:hypothetical protein